MPRWPSTATARRVSLDLTDRRFDPVFAYWRTAMPEATLREAVIELLHIATSSVASDGAVYAARRTAYVEASRMVNARLAQVLGELKADLETGSLRAAGKAEAIVEGRSPFAP